MNRFIETAVMLAAVCGFFGFIYPELCFIDDTYKVVMEAPGAEAALGTEAAPGAEAALGAEAAGAEAALGAETSGAEAGEIPEVKAGEVAGIESGKWPESEAMETSNDIFRAISNAPPERIRMKSKIIEYFMEIR